MRGPLRAGIIWLILWGAQRTGWRRLPAELPECVVLVFFSRSQQRAARRHRSSLGATENRSLDPPPLMPTPIGALALWVGRMRPGHAAWCLFGRRVVYTHPCPQHLWVAVCSHETLQLQAHAYPLEEVQVHAV